MFSIPKILDNLDSIEQLVNSNFSFGHDFVHGVDDNLVILAFTDSETWAAIVGVKHASFSLFEFVLRKSLALRLWIWVWCFENFVVVWPD